MADIIDISTSDKSVVRIVRPGNKVSGVSRDKGTPVAAYGGERVCLDESELEQPQIAEALWTDAEYEAAYSEWQKRQAQGFIAPPPPAVKAVDEALARAVQWRQQQAEKARVVIPENVAPPASAPAVPAPSKKSAKGG